METNPQPLPASDNQPSLEHEQPRRRGRVGNTGLGQTTKESYRTGENQSLVNALYNDIDTRVRHQRERPQHRRMLDLTCQGFNIREVANLMDVTKQSVSTTLRQPWAREYMIEQSRKDVLSDVRKLLEDETLPSLKKLIELRDDPDARPETQKACADSILDRVLGKAAQPIITAKLDTSKATDDELTAIIRGHSSGGQSSN